MAIGKYVPGWLRSEEEAIQNLIKVTNNYTNTSVNGLHTGKYVNQQAAIAAGNAPGDYYYNTTTKVLEQIPNVYDEPVWVDKTLTQGTQQRFSFADDTNSKDYFNMPSMVKNVNNGWLYGYFRAATSHSDFSDSAIYQMISKDGGATWASYDGLSDFDEILADDANGGWDAPAVCQTPTGRLLMFTRYFNNANAYQSNRTFYSDDNGQTWTEANAWAPNSIGYVYFDELMVAPNGAICIAFRDIQTSRYIRVYQSTDDGLTWTLRSTALDNTDKGWNFGECMMQDYGGGLWVMINRFSAANDDAEHYPFICVSHDYGLTWAGSNQTLDFQDVQDGLYGSGFLKLEGVGNSLGTSSAAKSCLPYFHAVEKDGKRYALISYHLRNVGSEGQLKACVFDIDKWLESGQEAIKDDVQLFIYPESPEGPGNIYDVEGNHSNIIDSRVNPKTLIGLTSYDDVTGGSSSGPQTIHFYAFNKIDRLIWLYENRSMYHGLYANDTAAATGGCAVGQVYYNTTNDALHTRMT